MGSSGARRRYPIPGGRGPADRSPAVRAAGGSATSLKGDSLIHRTAASPGHPRAAGRCERCGRAAATACPRHPSAALLDPRDPAAQDWLEGLDGLRRQRRALGFGLAVVVLCASLAVAALWVGLLAGPADPTLHRPEPTAIDRGMDLLRAFTAQRVGWIALLGLGAGALPAAARAEGARRRAATAMPALIAAVGAAVAAQLDGYWTGWAALIGAAVSMAAAAALRRRLAGPDPADPWRALADDAARDRLAAAEPFRLGDLDGPALDRAERGPARAERPVERLSGGG